jgi:hypothetical protein
VAQALLPVRVLLHLCWAHSQEWLCHLTFSAASSASLILNFEGRGAICLLVADVKSRQAEARPTVTGMRIDKALRRYSSS